MIDGNEQHQMLSALALGRRGFRVTAANSGREGLQIALTRPFDAIVLDHKVRDRAAFEVLERLVERLPKVPKIFVVAPGAEDVAVKALEAGATGYLVKTAKYNEVLPVEVEDQILRARTVAQLHEQRNALDRDIEERTRVEEALRASEERLRLLVSRAPFVLWTTDADERITSFLGSGLFSLGRPPEQVLGKALIEVLGPDDAGSPFLDAHRRALHGETTRFEQAWRGRTYDVHIEPLRTKGGRVVGVLGVGLDITERVRSARLESAVYRISQAANTSERLEDLFRSIHEVVGELMPARNFYIALHDPATNTLTFPYFVDEKEDAPPRRPLGKGLTEYVLRTGGPLLASPEVFDRLVASGEVVPIGAPSIDWLGVPLKAKGTAFGVLAVQSYTEGVRYTEQDRDILEFVSTQIAMAVERKRAEATLRERERALSSLLAHLPGVAYRCLHDEDRTDLLVSEGIYELTGRDPADPRGGGLKAYGQFIHPEDRARVKEEIDGAVRERRPYHLLYRLRTAKGEEKTVWEQGRGMYGEDGRLQYLEGLIIDVTSLRAKG